MEKAKYPNYGKYFKQLRSNYFDDQKSLAKEIGVTKSTVGMWESGVNIPRAKYWPKLLVALKCNSLDFLFKPLIENIQLHEDPLIEEICEKVRSYWKIRPDFKTMIISLMEVIEPPPKEEGAEGGKRVG